LCANPVVPKHTRKKTNKPRFLKTPIVCECTESAIYFNAQICNLLEFETAIQLAERLLGADNLKLESKSRAINLANPVERSWISPETQGNFRESVESGNDASTRRSPLLANVQTPICNCCWYTIRHNYLDIQPPFHA